MSDSGLDLTAFRAFEQAGWGNPDIAGQYNDWFPSLTSQAVPTLLEVLALGIGHSLLDVACGPGLVADAAMEAGALAVGIDFSRSMVETAAALYTDVYFAQGDAERLPFRRSTFDMIAMNYGLLHLAHPDDALRDILRVLKPGGSFGFTVWAPPQQAIGFQIILDAIAARGAPGLAPPGPPFFRFSDAAESMRSLQAAGFVDPQVLNVPQTWRLPSAGAFFAAMSQGTVRTGALLRSQDDASLGAIKAHVEHALQPYATPDGIELPMPAVLSWAVKP